MDYTGYNNAEEASLGGTVGYNRNVDEDNVTKHADVDVAYDAADEYDDVDEGKDAHVLDDDYWWWDCYLQDSIDYGEAPRLKEIGNNSEIMITIPIGGRYVIAATLLRLQDQRWPSECIGQDIGNVTEVEQYDLARLTHWVPGVLSVGWGINIGSLVLGAMFLSLVRISARWQQ